jgi:2-polyprenyl-3-methyl-5-hydroxy-6-metoxy-1,4-benzoquinol methylase
MQTRDYDKEAADHPAHAYAFEFDYIMHGYMMRTFEPWIIGERALELGCYHGNFTRLLCDRFPRVEVVEASADCIAQATKTTMGRPKFHHSRFEEFHATQTFEDIFLIHTLEHLDARPATLARIGKWLSPQGRLFVATPNAFAGSRQIAVAMGLIQRPEAVTEPERAHGHRITFSLESLSAEVDAAGLTVLARGGIFFKGLANFQLDRALTAGIISPEYLDGCYDVGLRYPELCSSIYVVCEAR